MRLRRAICVVLQLLAWLITLSPTTSLAANIYVYNVNTHGLSDPPGSRLLMNGSIVIDGEIVDGDYERFVSAVASAGFEKGHVYISSPGGNVKTAVNIGALIRALRFTTEVPDNIQNQPKCWSENLSVCTCASACPLIYLSGVQRKGNFLAIHRTFIQKETLGNLSFGDAQRIGRLQSDLVDQYLHQMGAPRALSEEMHAIPSSDFRILPREFVQTYLSDPPETDEWLSAKCGNFEAITKRAQDLPKKMYDATLSDYFDCLESSLRDARAEAFSMSLMEALDSINPDRMPSDLRAFSEHRSIDLAALLGRDIMELQDEVQWLGLRSIRDLKPSQIVQNGLSNGVVTISATGDTIARVQRIKLILPQYAGPVRPGISGKDLSLPWAIQEFGTPIGEIDSSWNEDLRIVVFKPTGRKYVVVVWALHSTGELTGVEYCTESSCSAFLDRLKKSK